MEKNNFDYVYSFFKSYIIEKNGYEFGEKILNKGKEIVDTILSFPEKNRNFLMVGKIQSGKTINFISVIANAILKEIKFFIILTATDNKLNEQTLERLKTNLGFSKNGNFLKILHIKEICNSKEKIRDMVNDIEKDFIYIITSLKNNKIKNLCNLLRDEINHLKDIKVLIVDDEGDLASMSHTLKNSSKTFDNISDLKNITKGYYLSVTATPQVHLITDQKNFLYPDFAFYIEPGEKYFGLKEFNENIHVTLQDIDSKEWYKEEIFCESILYYLIIVSLLLTNKQFDRTTHSNMLIHTDKKNIKHLEYRQKVNALLNYYGSIFIKNKNDISYKDFMTQIRGISNKYELNINFDDGFLENFKESLKNIKVIEINQTNNAKINDNFCSIIIGSTLVGRGITFDNLIVTFFTNRPKTKIAMDTLLQRARWFGYRDEILNFVKIYTTKKIFEDFKNTEYHDEEICQILKNGEKNKILFKDLEIPVKTYSEDLSLTNKAPHNSRPIDQSYFFNSIVNDIYFLNKQDQRLFYALKKSTDYFCCSFSSNSKYQFKCLNLPDFDSLFQFIDREIFSKLINVSDSHLNEIEKIIKKHNKKDILVVLLDNVSEKKDYLIPRERTCNLENNKYKIDQIFQGENVLNTTEETLYVGDRYWNKLPEMNDKIFIQIHYISPVFSKKNIKDFAEIFAMVLFLPNWMNEQKIFIHKPIILDKDK